MTPTTALSDEARLVLDFIERGYLLRVQHGELTGTMRYPPTRPQMPDSPKPMKVVSDTAVGELLNLPGFMHKLTKNRVNQRSGWEEMKLDGRDADFYCMAQ